MPMGHHEQNKKNTGFNILGDATCAYIQGLSNQDNAEHREIGANKSKSPLSRPLVQISEISV